MKINTLKYKYLYKVFHWEYWPSSLFYIPNIPYGFFLAVKAKHLVFFSAANPGIKSSGNGTESKFQTLSLIPDEFKPKSIFHGKGENFENTIKKIREQHIQFPLIAKPDIGFRGLLVQKIHSEIELKNYLQKFKIDFIIQEFITYNNECGIFYSRNPTQKKGIISSITLKKFLTITGDGISTVKELIISDKRAFLYKDLIFENHKELLGTILEKNKEFQLSVIGNHCKGTQFINGNHLISNELSMTFDELNAKIPGWFYGRIDIKYDDFETLKDGKNFKILEINGIISEPTHIYDAQKSTYFSALKSIRNHWKILFEISTTNHKINKIPYKNSLIFWKEIRELKKYSKKITALDSVK